MNRHFLPVSRLLGLVFSSSLFRAAGTYGFFSLLGAAIPFLLLPVMTRYLTPNDYGLVAIFGIMVTLITPFVGCNMHGAYSRAYFATDRFDVDVYMGTVVGFVLVSGTAFLGVVYFFRGTIGDLFSFPSSWVWIVPIVATSSVLAEIVLVAWQVREAPSSYGIFQNGRTLFEILGALFLVVVLGMGWQGRLISRIVIFVLFACLGIFVLLRGNWLSLRFNKSYLCHALSFGIPLIPHSLAGILNTTIDRIFITNMVGMTETGLYTVGYQIGSIIVLVAGAFNKAYVPWLFNKLNRDSWREKINIVRLTYIYFFISTLGVFIFSWISPLLMSVFVGKAFKDSTIFIIWIAMGSAFNGMYYMVVNYIFYAEKTYLLAWVTFLGAIINVVLNYFFIRLNGAVGAAQATSLSCFISFVFVWYLSAKAYRMPWKDALNITN
ncbi:MAG: polysaccharide biosynthesis protein [Deltaproteobacteria bacterium]|nr:MAG: polysaccharide biosynthesis protein [Deltaproteobacteria bacterium]